MGQFIVYTNQRTTKSISSLKQANIYMIKYTRIWPVVPLLSLLEKRFLIKHIFETQKTFANQLGTDASQMYPISICQEMTTGLYIIRAIDSNSQKFKARQKKSKNMIMLYLQKSILTDLLKATTQLIFRKRLIVLISIHF